MTFKWTFSNEFQLPGKKKHHFHHKAGTGNNARVPQATAKTDNQQQQRTYQPTKQQQQNCKKNNTHEHLTSPHKAPRVSSLRFSNRSPTWLSPGGCSATATVFESLDTSSISPRIISKNKSFVKKTGIWNEHALLLPMILGGSLSLVDMIMSRITILGQILTVLHY